MTGEVVIFWVTAIFSVIGAVGLVISRKAVHSALWVAFTMINLAVLYFSLGGAFLGTTQIVVYTGAVMMLFLFVLMIVGVDSSDSLIETIKGQRLVGTILAFAFGALLTSAITTTGFSAAAGVAVANDANGGNIEGLAQLIFGRYLLAFEVTSALLITAALGAMVLAHNERWTPRKTQAQLQRERTLAGHPTPLPSPGVLALHNSVDTPALLPDGSPSQESLPRIFKSVEQSDDSTNNEVTS
ncbi:MAG: NADH-quinone oxidoreductase subunit J [Actinobacteria bacterium]|nr:NADH-quinone oxidoreductase subunit J [Actinomycetota bacterium]